MKKAFSLFSILLAVSIFLASCGGSERKPVKHEDPSDTEVVDDTDPTDEPTNPTDTASNCGNRELEEGEVCDGNAMECNIIDPGYTGGYATCNADCMGWDVSDCQGNQTDPTDTEDPTEPTESTEPDVSYDAKVCETNNEGEIEDVFVLGPYFVNIIDVAAGTDGAPRQFRIYEPTGAEGKIPVIHFLHGFMYKIAYYDDFLTHLASHGFIVVSSQSEHKMTGGDTTYVESDKVITFLNWLKQNIKSKVSVTADVEHFGVSGHSRGGKVTNRVLNAFPTMATSFFGVDPVDSAPPLGGSSDPSSLNDPVQFTRESMFLGTEKGPDGMIGSTGACAPAGDNSVNFYANYPSVSHHIIAAGVGHADMVDPNDVSSCGTYCSLCAKSSNNALNQQFISYTGGLMTAFFKSTLKCETQYEALLNDSSTHPFATTLTEHK